MTDNITPRAQRENLTVNLKELSELRHGDNKNFVLVESIIVSKERHYVSMRYIVKRLDEKYFHFYYDSYYGDAPYDEDETYILSEVFPKEKTIIVYE